MGPKVVLHHSRPEIPPASKGIETPVYLAASPETATVTGQYFIKKQPARSPRQTYDLEVARWLWNAGEALTSGAAETATAR